MSTNPGVTSSPSASISSRPAAGTDPPSLITPPTTATSARNGSPPLPSTTVPLRRTRSGFAMWYSRLGCAHRRAAPWKVKQLTDRPASQCILPMALSAMGCRRAAPAASTELTCRAPRKRDEIASDRVRRAALHPALVDQLELCAVRAWYGRSPRATRSARRRCPSLDLAVHRARSERDDRHCASAVTAHAPARPTKSLSVGVGLRPAPEAKQRRSRDHRLRLGRLRKGG